jgi:hypothetical protein
MEDADVRFCHLPNQVVHHTFFPLDEGPFETNDQFGFAILKCVIFNSNF